MDLPDRPPDLGGRRSFQQVASCASLYRPKHIVVRIIGSEHDDAAVLAREARDAVGGAGVGQLQIEEDDVRVERRRQSKTIRDRVRRAEDGDVGLALEHGGHALADDWMILDDQDADHVCSIHHKDAKGTRPGHLLRPE